MKKLLAASVALCVLAACSQEAEAPPAEETTAALEPTVMTDANGDSSDAYLGAWDVTYPDGSVGSSTNNADGTYDWELSDGTTGNGTWTFGVETSCWDQDGAGEAEEVCYTVGAPGEDGSRSLTTADGTQLTVKPKTDASAAEATM